MLADFIHLALASIFIIFFIVAIFDWLNNRKPDYKKNAIDTLAQVDDELEWYNHLERYGNPVNQSKRLALLSERETLLILISEENR